MVVDARRHLAVVLGTTHCEQVPAPNLLRIRLFLGNCSQGITGETKKKLVMKTILEFHSFWLLLFKCTIIEYYSFILRVCRVLGRN